MFRQIKFKKDSRVEFNELKTEIKKIELAATRIDDDNYFEAVVDKNCLARMVHLLESIFGSPAWPSNNKLPRETEKVIKNFGGLRPGQTLYALNGKSFSAFAMLWPWQDGEKITVKIARM